MEHNQDTEKDIKVIPQEMMESEGMLHDEKSITENQAESLVRINDEFKKGFDFLKKFNATVSFFGSARFSENDPHAKMAETLAAKIVKELGYAVITGGGPGIMQAANKGATEAGGESLGIMIKLPMEQHTNKYVKEGVEFQYFFTRKTILTFAAEAYVVFPGGFGTMDELFEVATLIKTKRFLAYL